MVHTPVYTNAELDDIEKEVAPLAHNLPMTVLASVYTDVELDDIEKEVAPLAQDLPTEIEDEIIPQEIG